MGGSDKNTPNSAAALDPRRRAFALLMMETRKCGAR
jgi:hypothetical protein